MVADREAVILAYQLLLGRPPETEAVISPVLRYRPQESFCETLIHSPEFEAKHTRVCRASSRPQ